MNIRDVLTMPEIISRIAQYVHDDEFTLKSMYMLFNDKIYHDELKLFIGPIFEKRKEEFNQIMEKINRNISRIHQWYEISSEQYVPVLMFLHHLVYHHPEFFNYNALITSLHHAFPNQFKDAMFSYLNHYALMCKTRKIQHYNKVMTLIDKDRLHSYPLQKSCSPNVHIHMGDDYCICLKKVII